MKPAPNPRVQRTRSSASPRHEPLTRHLLGAAKDLRRLLLVSLAIAGFVGAAPHSSAVKASGECAKSLPSTLAQSLGQLYPSSALLTLDQLDRQARSLFVKEEGLRCPGVVRLDFFGDHREAYGVVVVTGAGEASRSHLVLASRIDVASQWSIQTLHTLGDPSLATVAKEKAGSHEDLYRERKIEAKGEALVWIGWESWATLYAWSGEKIEKIWLSD